jgi:hypothetical protein
MELLRRTRRGEARRTSGEGQGGDLAWASGGFESLLPKQLSGRHEDAELAPSSFPGAGLFLFETEPFGALDEITRSAY